MMIRKAVFAAFVAVLAFHVTGSLSHARSYAPVPPPRCNDLVEVSVISDTHGDLNKFRLHRAGLRDGEYYYLEAFKGDRYSIQITNKTDRRLGVVVAVDGRNIVSGARSTLVSKEGMYLLDAFQSQAYDGWRASMTNTNRFYFTDQPDSYAEKVFSDGSAMGTIAVAVFEEIMPPPQVMYRSHEMNNAGKDRGPSFADTAPPSARAKAESASQAGTGFGETTYSPVQLVDFKPRGASSQKVVLKYEWRDTLCKMGVVSCKPKNRLWPVDRNPGGFAPIPDDFHG
jgi:hypothetical protein